MVLSNTFSFKKQTMEQTVAEQFDFLLSQIDKRDLEELDRTLSEEDSASHSAQFPVARAALEIHPLLFLSSRNKPCPSSRFALKTDEELEQAKTNAIPKNTLYIIALSLSYSPHKRFTLNIFTSF